jgi:D-aminopeptidase
MSPIHALIISVLTLSIVVSAPAFPQSHTEPRARDLGVPFDGTPGPLNAITDVAGVEVGYYTYFR